MRLHDHKLNYSHALLLLLLFHLVGCKPVENKNKLADKFSISLGDQRWDKNNLSVMTYRNGDTIPQVSDGEKWDTLTSGAWCYYDNDSVNGTQYGKLYNGYALNDKRGLAPTGWRLPADSDWLTLANFYGGMQQAAGKMGAMIPAMEGSHNNKAAFSANGGGRYDQGIFLFMEDTGNWWITPGDSNAKPLSFTINGNSSSVKMLQQNRHFGFSVRCLR